MYQIPGKTASASSARPAAGIAAALFGALPVGVPPDGIPGGGRADSRGPPAAWSGGAAAPARADTLSRRGSPMLNIKSLREQVYQFLRDEMHAGRLLPDTTLNLNAISQRLGISKTPLRDALLKLEVEGFVTILPRRGVIINALTLEDVRNFYQIVGALEGAVVEEVFPLLDSSHISALRQITADMREALRRDDFDHYYALNIRFHDVFLDLSANKALHPLIMPMKQRLYDFQRRPYVKDWEFRNCQEHDTFIDAIKAGDAVEAARLMRDVHWSFEVQEGFIREFYRREALERLQAQQARA